MKDELSDLLDELGDSSEMKEELVVEAKEDDIVEEASSTQIIEQPKPESKEIVSLDLTKIMNAHESDYGEAMKNLRCDRTKIDSVVNILMERVDNGGAKCAAAEIEGLVRACDSLANTNMCVVRLMDSRSKMVVALKGHINKASLSGGPVQESSGDLKSMLEQPEEDV
jgi:hypothetical protein